MIKKLKLTLINNYNDLLTTHEVLKRNVENLKLGKRFDHFPEGHDNYERMVNEALAIVEARLKVFGK